MEKLKKVELENNSSIGFFKDVADEFNVHANKINEIIDWFKRLAESCIESDAKKEDRLKTLEDKIEEFDNRLRTLVVTGMCSRGLGEGFKESLQDLYDEQKKKITKKKWKKK